MCDQHDHTLLQGPAIFARPGEDRRPLCEEIIPLFEKYVPLFEKYRPCLQVLQDLVVFPSSSEPPHLLREVPAAFLARLLRGTVASSLRASRVHARAHVRRDASGGGRPTGRGQVPDGHMGVRRRLLRYDWKSSRRSPPLPSLQSRRCPGAVPVQRWQQ